MSIIATQIQQMLYIGHLIATFMVHPDYKAIIQDSVIMCMALFET